LTQQIPAPPSPKKSSRKRTIGIAALVIGLVVVLALGVFVLVLFSFNKGSFAGNGLSNVLVWGTVSETQTGTIKFSNDLEVSIDRSMPVLSTSVPIVNGQYDVDLVGGHSYNVYVYVDGHHSYDYSYSLYAPLGVGAFKANF
jgi:hypothetical protein